MNKKVALITGINGQDGSYLSEYLFELGYEVHGTVRRNSVPENQNKRINFLEKEIITHYADLLDFENMTNLINDVAPDDADKRNYSVNFDKIAIQLEFKTKVMVNQGFKEIYEALKNGTKDTGTKTVTFKWYGNILEAKKLLDSIILNERIILMTHISVVALIYNEEQNIKEFVSRVKITLEKISTD